VRLLADENIPRTVVVARRDAGHDVLWVGEYRRGADDPSVLEVAIASDRALRTSDLDFGGLILRDLLPAPPALLMLRFRPEIRYTAMADGVVRILATRDSWPGLVVVVVVIEDDPVRTAPLPAV
jgi:predicted nuclease of predicted toxin-antitoxin system